MISKCLFGVFNFFQKTKIVLTFFTVWINCSSDLKKFASSPPWASNFKSFSQSLEQFLHTVQWVRTILVTKYQYLAGVNWKSQEVFATNWQHFLHWRQECQDKCGVSFFVWLRDQFVSKRSFKMSQGKFFIMSMEFDKNISDWNHDCTDHKNGIGFFMWLVKWPKIAAKKSQKFQKF